MAEHGSGADWIAQALARHEAPLLRYATRFLQNADRARDVVQETFLALCRADRSKVEGHLAAWLFRVCRNRALDMRRKETRVEPLEQAVEQTLQSPDPDPSAIAEQREDASQVMKILQTLPDNQQEAVYLRFQGGLSYKQISEVTGHSVSNVGFMLHAAVKKIRQHLDEIAGPAAKTAENAR